MVEGKGGTVRSVDGIDFWDNGTPDRKFKIIGVIDDTRRESLIFRSSPDRAIAKTARDRGGDAVVFESSLRQFRGFDVNSGAALYSKETKLVVIKYLP